MSRDRRISFRLAEAELARLDELSGGRGRGVALRELLRGTATAVPSAPPTVAEALELLAASARDGSVPAQVALARLLSEQGREAAARTPTQTRRDELRARREAKRGPA